MRFDAVPVGGTVYLRATQTDSDIELSVEGLGSGINAASQGLLVQPFFSTKGDLGDGLVLYISRGIIDKHKG